MLRSLIIWLKRITGKAPLPVKTGGLKAQLDMRSVRAGSLKIASEMGYVTNPHLPEIENEGRCKSASEIANRLLCLHATAASAVGYDVGKSWDWLNQVGAVGSVTSAERDFLREGIGEPTDFEMQIEGMWALAWVLRMIPKLDFASDCAGDFVRLFPDFRTGEGGEKIRRFADVRPHEDILKAADLAYCLHWATVHAVRHHVRLPNKVQAFAIRERRRALDWVLLDEEWDEISPDT